MFYTPLGSGSAGNSYYFESGSTAILIDAGFGPRDTAKRLKTIGRSLESVKAIVLTHEHHDHIHGAAKIALEFDIPIFLTEGTLAASAIDPAGVPTSVFKNGSSFRIGDLLVHARRTSHDAADSACFVVEEAEGTRVGLATDLGFVEPSVIEHLSGCDALLFEANHDLDMLRSGTYPWSLKRRIMSRYGHLSNDDSMTALRRVIGAELKTLTLIHLSEKNNHESIVRAMASAVIAETGACLDLRIARQDRPLEAMTVTRRAPVAVAARPQLMLF